MNKKDNFLKLLSGLSDNLDKYLQISAAPNKYWYWEYYKATEKEIEDKKLRRKIYQQIYHLEKFGHLDKKGFTQKGVSRLMSAKINKSANNEKWDKKWRIVIFDIPEKLRIRRNCLRDSLKKMGFLILQNSIWISPFGDFDEIQELVKYYKIEKYVVLILADKISNDILYKNKFGI